MRTNIWRVVTGKHNHADDFNHPAVFPMSLAKDHIISWSNETDIVLDPFLGSGTTIKMANHTNRVGLGFEINPEYEPIIRKRMMADIPKLESWFGEITPNKPIIKDKKEET